MPPPPPVSDEALPRILNPEIVTVLLAATLNTRDLLNNWRALDPGPLMVTFLATSSSPALRVIVPVTEKVIVSPLLAMLSAQRNEPGMRGGTLSSVLVTVIVSAWTFCKPATAAQSNPIIKTILLFMGNLHWI
jgi:hypothetical protein